MKKVLGPAAISFILALLLTGCDSKAATGKPAIDENVYTRATFKGGPGLVIDTSGTQLEKYLILEACSRQGAAVVCKVHTGKAQEGYEGFHRFVGYRFRAEAQGFDGKNFYDMPGALVFAPDYIYPERYAEIRIHAPEGAQVVYLSYDWNEWGE